MHEYSDAAAVQQLVLMTLDRGVPGVALDPGQFNRLLMDVTAGLDARVRRSNNHSRSHTPALFARYSGRVRSAAGNQTNATERKYKFRKQC